MQSNGNTEERLKIEVGLRQFDRNARSRGRLRFNIDISYGASRPHFSVGGFAGS